LDPNECRDSFGADEFVKGFAFDFLFSGGLAQGFDLNCFVEFWMRAGLSFGVWRLGPREW
jgi:hypothetical protein